MVVDKPFLQLHAKFVTQVKIFLETKVFILAYEGLRRKNFHTNAETAVASTIKYKDVYADEFHENYFLYTVLWE